MDLQMQSSVIVIEDDDDEPDSNINTNNTIVNSVETKVQSETGDSNIPCIDLGTITSVDETIYKWDYDVIKWLTKASIVESESAFMQLMDKYYAEIKNLYELYPTNNTLRWKILRQMHFWYSYYTELKYCVTDNYLEKMEEICRIYCDLEFNIINLLRKRHCTANEYQKRIMMVCRRVKYALTTYLLNNGVYIYHVLMKAYPNIQIYRPSEACKKVLNGIYKHFFTLSPCVDVKSKESYIRLYLLFEKWKQIRKETDYPQMDEVLVDWFDRTPEDIDKDITLRNILKPDQNTSAEKARNFYRRIDYSAHLYFEHIKNLKKREHQLEYNINIDLCDFDSVSIISDTTPKETDEDDDLDKAYKEFSKRLASCAENSQPVKTECFDEDEYLAPTPRIKDSTKISARHDIEISCTFDTPYRSDFNLHKANESISIGSPINLIDDDCGCSSSATNEELRVQSPVRTALSNTTQDQDIASSELQPTQTNVMPNVEETTKDLSIDIEDDRNSYSSFNEVLRIPESPEPSCDENNMNEENTEHADSCSISSLEIPQSTPELSMSEGSVETNTPQKTEITAQANHIRQMCSVSTRTESEELESLLQIKSISSATNAINNVMQAGQKLVQTRTVEVQADEATINENNLLNVLTPPYMTNDEQNSKSVDTCVYMDIVQSETRKSLQDEERFIPTYDAHETDELQMEVSQKYPSNHLISTAQKPLLSQKKRYKEFSLYNSNIESSRDRESSRIEQNHCSEADLTNKESINYVDKTNHIPEKKLTSRIAVRKEFIINSANTEKEFEKNIPVDTGQILRNNDVMGQNINHLESINTKEVAVSSPDIGIKNGNTLLKLSVPSDENIRIGFTQPQPIRETPLDAFSQFEQNFHWEKSHFADEVFSGPVSAKLSPKKHNVTFAPQEKTLVVIENMCSRSNSPNDISPSEIEGIDDFREYYGTDLASSAAVGGDGGINGITKYSPNIEARPPPGILKSKNAVRRETFVDDSSLDSVDRRQDLNCEGIQRVRLPVGLRNDQKLRLIPIVVLPKLEEERSNTIRIDFDKTTPYINENDVVRYVSLPKPSILCKSDQVQDTGSFAVRDREYLEKKLNKRKMEPGYSGNDSIDPIPKKKRVSSHPSTDNVGRRKKKKFHDAIEENIHTDSGDSEKSKVQKKAWSPYELSLVKEQFSAHIEKRIYPSTADINSFIEISKISRTVNLIKSKIQHLIKQQKESL